ncbi:steroid transmembrane transporter SLC22A24-like [Macrotis lagotis]|uniref:steroid transmembrane transporter SLC22A24-like n=1 Tax=Macrotis lagotis TaxID=92651 RepID=UPI003D691CBE
MAFEDLLPEVGARGRFHVLQDISLGISLIFVGCHFLIENFTAFVPEHRCRIPFLDNTSALFNVSTNLNFSSLLKLSIPLDSKGKLERCLRFSWPQWLPLSPNVTGQNRSQLETEPCVDGWVYDQSIITSSIVTEWNLVCGFQTLKSLSQSIFFAGNLVGYVTWGFLSDRFGRKWTILSSLLMVAVSSTGAFFVQSFPVYCCFRFLLGSSISGFFLCSGTMIQEWTTSQYRPLVIIIFGLCVSLGHMLLGVVTYVIQEWRKLQLVVSVPLFAFLLTIWWLPESPRWLIVHRKYDEALNVLRKVAKINGVKDENLTVEALRSTTEKELVPAQTHYTMLDLVHLSNLRTRILCLSFAGFTLGVIFYGLSLDLQYLGHNIQMLQVLLGISTLLSRLGTIFIMNHLGRRTILVAGLLLAGLFIPASVFLPQEILHVVLSMLAVNCIVVCISYNGVYATELIPTVVRNRFRGLTLLVDRVGAMLAPLVVTLRHYSPYVSPIIFAIMAITAGLVIFFFLPETQNKPMPDTMQEIEYGHSREEARPKDKRDTTVKISQF